MQQTLLALLALLVATLLSFNQQQASVQNQAQVVRAEMQMMALGVAMQTMEVVRARDFDAAMEENSESEILSDYSNKLTRISNFGKEYIDEDNYGPVKDCKFHPTHSSKAKCDYMEEYHNTSGKVPFSLGKDGDGNKEVFQFSVSIKVKYVEGNFGSTGDKTLQKKVEIFVQDESSRLVDPIRYSQVISYP